MSISDLQPDVPSNDGPAGEGALELREIKAALVEAFPAVDGPITNTSGTGSNPPDATTWSNLFTRLAAAESGAGDGIVGEIKSFYGDIANIPTGWYLCNGTNGTPDLTGRFLIGANSGSGLPTYEGQTFGGELGTGGLTGAAGSHTHTVGGIADHFLSAANLPPHDHNLFGGTETSSNGDPPKPGATDTVAYKNDASGVGTAYAVGAGSGSPSSGVSGMGQGSSSAVGHTGSVDSVAAHQHTLGDESLPPWNAVYYIMFTGA
jgi:microcystin-dependent protein